MQYETAHSSRSSSTVKKSNVFKSLWRIIIYDVICEIMTVTLDVHTMYTELNLPVSYIA